MILIAEGLSIGDEPSIIQLSSGVSNITAITKTTTVIIVIPIIIGNDMTKYKEE